MDEFFLTTNDFSLFESCQLFMIEKYKASNCCKIESVTQRRSVKKVLLKILQDSRENPCARAYFLIKLQLKKRLRHRCYCEIVKKTFFCRTSPVVASSKIRTKSLKSAKFQFQLFLTTLDYAPSTLWRNSCKTWYPKKNIFSGVHS